RNSAAALRRYKVQLHLLELHKKDEKNADTLTLTEKARREAEKSLKIAADDKKNVEAQVILLNLAFMENQLQDALTYAENLLDSNIEQDDEMVKKHPTELAAAHFLKGRAALRAVPPRPDEALNQVKACMELKKRVPSRDEKERWREIDLEARAL